MESRKQTAGAGGSPQPFIGRDEWVDLSRKLLERSQRCFSHEERLAVSGFINFVADDVESIQEIRVSEQGLKCDQWRCDNCQKVNRNADEFCTDCFEEANER